MSVILSACVCVVLFVPRDIVYRWTDLVLIYSEPLQMPWKVKNYFWGGYDHPPKRNLPWINPFISKIN